MSSFIKNSLLTDEVIIKHGKVWWSSRIVHLVLGLGLIFFGAALPFLVLLGFWVLGVVIFNILTTELVLTNKRIIGKTGWIKVKAIDLPLVKVESVLVTKEPFFNCGNLVISGTGGHTMQFRNIGDAVEFRKMALELIDKVHANNQTR